MSFVLDASVALAWVLPDEGNPYANEFLERLIAEGAVVPPIWPLEIGHVLLVALRRGRMRQEEFEAVVEHCHTAAVHHDGRAPPQPASGCGPTPP